MNRYLSSYIEVIAFLFCISLGYWIGTNIGESHSIHEQAQVVLPTPSPIPALPDGERILLLVGVDQIDSPHPNLTSIWLMTYYLNNQPVQLLPIFPSDNNISQQFAEQLISTFSILDKEGSRQLSPSFLRVLSNNNYWLSGYLIFDKKASAHMIDLLGGLPFEGALLSGEEIMNTIQSSKEHPLQALRQQTTLLGQACSMFSQLSQPQEWSTAVELIPQHIVTDLQPHRLLAEIQLLAANPSQVWCEFPVQSAIP